MVAQGPTNHHHWRRGNGRQLPDWVARPRAPTLLVRRQLAISLLHGLPGAWQHYDRFLRGPGFALLLSQRWDGPSAAGLASTTPLRIRFGSGGALGNPWLVWDRAARRVFRESDRDADPSAAFRAADDSG